MKEKLSRINLTLAAVAVLVIADIFVWSAVFSEKPSDSASVSFFDIGQGDSIFIEATNGNQILIDGGPDGSVLRELSAAMPFYDRFIDVVVATHPDADHIGGLVDVVERYRIGAFIEPGVSSDTAFYQALKSAVADKKIPTFLARRGMSINLGDGGSLAILFPDRDVSGVETNTASIVAKFQFGQNSVMLTGDSPQSIEEYLVSINGEKLASDILKAGHHGSRTSSSESFVSAVNPQIAIISAGKDNRYGHPHSEVIDLFSGFGVETLNTAKEGTIGFALNGVSIIRK
jgi:competence protein ComEC